MVGLAARRTWTHPLEEVFRGDGELARVMRAHPWHESPLGPPEAWPQSLRTAVSICLGSRFPILVWWGPELVMLYNDAYAPLIGAKHPQALGQAGRECFPEIWEIIGPMLGSVLDGGEATWSADQLLMLERKGYPEECYFTFSYSPIRVEEGGVGGVFTAVTETTGRVLGERRMRTLRDLGALAGQANDPVQAAALAIETLRGRPDARGAAIYAVREGDPAVVASTFGPADPPPAVLDVVGRVAATGRPVEVAELPPELLEGADVGDVPPRSALGLPVHASGLEAVETVLLVGLNPERELDAEYRAYLALVAEQAERLIGTARALAEERRRAAELAALDRAKTTFFGNVSHELRTPLTLILGPLEEALAAGGAVDPRYGESLEVIRRNALRLLRMVNTLLDFSRAESSRAVARFAPVDLAALTRELAGAFAEPVQRAGLRLDVECPPLAEPVYVDADAWEKVVLNLLSNAFKFTREGWIRVALSSSEGAARLTVSDTGTGIPPEELPRLFERFHRVRNDAARTHEGTGIGLALVHELVSLHGGAVEAESEPGRGTTFTVSVPLGSTHLPEAQVEQAREASASGSALPYVEEASRWLAGPGEEQPAEVLRDERLEGPRSVDADARIVVVDDNADMRDYLTRLLERRWRVEAHPDGASALEAIRADPPSLVLSDVMMPRLDGFGLLAALREDERLSALPVVLVSARAGEESAVEGVDAGADDYLVKPFSARELIARVRANLELARLRVEAGRLGALEEVRSRVITTVSHELRTPVSAIYGASKTLERAGLLDEATQRSLLAVISGQSERLARITSDILTAETLAAGVLALSIEAVDAGAVVAEAVTAAAAAAEGAPIRTRLPDARVAVRADRGRLQQILGNLLDNALKYSPADAEVELAVEPDGAAVRFVVSDGGIGVPPQEREQIFHRFYRVDPDQSGGVGGSGLGLYICRELTEAMGGRIWAEANEPAGTRFVLSLPAAA